MKKLSTLAIQVFNQDTLQTLLSRIAILGLGFLATIITVRFLGPSGRGYYFYILTLANVITQVCLLGLHSSNTYLVAKQPTLLKPLLINSIWVSAVLTTLVAIGVYVFLLLFPHHSLYSYHLFWIIFLAPNLVYYLLASNLLVGIGRISNFNILQIIGNLIIAVFLVIAGIFSRTPWSMLLALIIARTLTSIIMTIDLLTAAKTMTPLKFDFKLFNKGFNFSSKAYISAFMGNFILYAGTFFIKNLLDIKSVGYYSIAAQMNDTLAILPTTIAMILFPKLVKSDSYRWQHTKENLLITGITMALLCTLAWVLAKPFIILAFGKEYLTSATIFYFMLPGAFFYALIGIISQYLSAIGFPIMQVVIWIFGLLIVAIGNYFLIPLFNVNGSAIALSITFAILFLLLLIIAKIKSGIAK